MAELKDIALSLDALLAEVDLSKVTADGSGFEEMPDGYFLSEVSPDTKLTLSKSGKPMVSMVFIVVEDGYVPQEVDGIPSLVPAPDTKGRKIWINYVLDDKQKVKRFVSDMLKFELPEAPGQPILTEEYFKSTELLADALSCLVSSRIYINNQTYEKDGETRKRSNIVKWAVAGEVGLPC